MVSPVSRWLQTETYCRAAALSSSFRVILAVAEGNHTFEGEILAGSQGRRPNSLPSWTAWVRRRAPSLSKARLQWVLTVFSLT